jgi:flagellar basal-body rod protein FlgG
MNRALRTAATGMFAQQLNVDTIAHNLANVNTTGFKRGRAEFQDLMYQTLKVSASSEGTDILQSVNIEVGNGTMPVATLKSFAQGDLSPTENPMDVAIQGEGFFQVRRPDGTFAYTRDGSFKISSEGTLITSQGYIVDPTISLPMNASTVTVSRAGVIEAIVPGDATSVRVGQLEMTKFVNPAGLRSIGSNLLVESPASGRPITGSPATEGFGEIVQGYLEGSNVDIVEEMVNMITAQRAYEINSKTIKTVEEILTMANNLKG